MGLSASPETTDPLLQTLQVFKRKKC